MSPTAAAGGVVSAGESVTTPAPSTTSADITTYERLINTIGKSNINEECGIREVSVCEGGGVYFFVLHC